MSSADLNKPAIFLGKNQWVLSKAWLWEGCGHCITLISREYLRPAQSSMSIRGELQRAGVRQHKVIYQSSKMSPRSDQWLHVLHENVSTHAAFWADCVGWHVWAYFIVSWLQDCHRYTNCGVANHLNKKREEKKNRSGPRYVPLTLHKLVVIDTEAFFTHDNESQNFSMLTQNSDLQTWPC